MSGLATQAGVSKTLLSDSSNWDDGGELEKSKFPYRHTSEINWNGRSGDLTSVESVLSPSSKGSVILEFTASLSSDLAWPILCVTFPPLATLMVEIGGVGISSRGGGNLARAGGRSYERKKSFKIFSKCSIYNILTWL